MRNRRNDWQVAVGKLQREAVLFQNLRICRILCALSKVGVLSGSETGITNCR